MAKCKQCGKSGIMLKVDVSGLCLECLSGKCAALQKRITPEFEEAERLPELVRERREALAMTEACEAEVKRRIGQLSQQIKELEKQLLVANDAVTMESFALYVPRYDFTRSEDYKARLDAIRNDQKQMIRDKSAVIYNENWTVNGSKAEGKKLLSDMSKLFIRSFNNECDAAVAEVKFSNFDKCKERILKAFDTINALGKVNSMSLAFQYRQLKIDELTLAYEYQCKKQEEKEALRALREQQREEAKLAKEIEAARKEAEKERKHYLQALEKVKAQLDACSNEEEREAIREKQNDLIDHLDELTQKMEDIDYRQANQRAGYVYVISNIGSFGEGVYKIGMTRRLDPMERVYELGDASVPFQFDVHAMIFSDDAPQLEAALHQAFADRRVNRVNTRREYFRVSLDEIKAVVREHHDKTVEFTDTPDAQQYRETMVMEQES